MNRSESQSKLAPALVKALGELSNPKMSGINPHFKSKYAKLPDILEVTRPTLHKHGLCAMQDSTGSVLIVHESGEWIEFPGMPLTPSKNDPQGHIAALTYARRGYLTAALGICGDEDDDGNSASSGGGQASSGGQRQERSTEHPPASDGKVSEGQAKFLYVLCKLKCADAEATKQGIYTKFGVNDFRELPWRDGKALIERMKEMPDVVAKPVQDQQDDDFNHDDVPF